MKRKEGAKMKDISIWLVVFVMMAFAIRYSYQIWKREINPTLSTWIIFLLGTGLSLATYAIAEKHDFRSGILNIMDVIVVMIILLATIAWGNRGMRFKPFEKWHLSGVGAIIVYGLFSGDAWGSNIFTQVLICIGYIPTIQNLLVVKRNVESLTGWTCCIVAGLIALYPALVKGNSLAILYSIHVIVLGLSIIAIMTYYELRSRKERS